MKKYPLITERVKEHTVRYTLKLEGDPLPKGEALTQFFKDLADYPLLLKCGPSIPEKMNISYNGDVWTLIGQAEEQLDMQNISFEQNDDGKPAKSINPFEGKYG